jgi:rSAM/selenodomain-associated transferase 2
MTGRPIFSEPAGNPENRTQTLAVIVPTLNEEAALAALLESLRSQSQPAERTIVADAGSTDETVAIARRYGAEVLSGLPRGRGGQVAAALANVSEDIVLVAHADMRFDVHSLERVRRSLVEHPDAPGGCLGHCFDQTSCVLKLLEWCDRRRARRGESYGDQAQFFRRELLQSVGAYPDQPLMEDVELSRRLRRLGPPLYVDLPVTVSARRFTRDSWWKSVWMNWRLRRRYRREGPAACAKLYEMYYRR